MNTFKQLSRDLQIVLGGTVLYLIMSFLDWQQVSFGPVSGGVTEWHGIGIVAGLLALALLGWEVARLLAVKVELPLTPGQVSVGLALLLLLFTVITFLSHSAYRHWPEYVGLILSIVVAGAAVRRGRTEGVEMPKNIAAKMSSATAGSADATVAEPEPASEPAASPNDAPAPDVSV